jgi:hypothetical protein
MRSDPVSIPDGGAVINITDIIAAGLPDDEAMPTAGPGHWVGGLAASGTPAPTQAAYVQACGSAAVSYA